MESCTLSPADIDVLIDAVAFADASVIAVSIFLGVVLGFMFSHLGCRIARYRNFDRSPKRLQ